jgi:hypothetical protein
MNLPSEIKIPESHLLAIPMEKIEAAILGICDEFAGCMARGEYARGRELEIMVDNLKLLRAWRLDREKAGVK